VEILTKTT